MRKCLALLLVFLSFNCFAQTGITNPTLNDRYGKKIGGLRFSVTNLSFGTINNNEERRDTIFIYNSTQQKINLTIDGKLPPHLALQFQSSELAPGTEGWIIISFDAAKKNDFGFILERVILNTNDTDQPQKALSVSATINEYFSAGLDSVKPKARISEMVFNYGTLKQSEKAEHDFVVYNDGISALKLHKTKSSCGCIKTSFSKNEIPQGDSAIVHVVFDSFGKEGKDSRNFSLFVNDSSMPEIKFEVKGEVLK
jgi:hypothetical protein